LQQAEENKKWGIFNFIPKGLCKGLAIVAVAATLGGCPNPTQPGGNQTQQVDSDQVWYHNAGGHWKPYDDNTKYGHGSHAFGAYETTQEPTTEAKGSEHAFCTVCGYENVREIPQLIVEKEDSDNIWHKDAGGHWQDYDDGEKYNQGAHVPGSWTRTQEPAYDAAGEESAACTTCGYNMLYAIFSEIYGKNGNGGIRAAAKNQTFWRLLWQISFFG
jgi:hypothetical protein